MIEIDSTTQDQSLLEALQFLRDHENRKIENLQTLEAVISQRLPERNVLDILCNVAHWTKWTRHFGPLSGSDPKIENAMERYIITSFGYGCNLGPTQTSKHMKKSVTPHMISFVNRRHINASNIDVAIRDILNQYNQFSLPKL